MLGPKLLIFLSAMYLLVSFHFVQAQTVEIQELTKELTKHPIQDTTRIVLLHELGRKWLNRDPGRASAYFREAESLALNLGEKRRQAMAIRNLAWIAAMQGRFDDASGTLHRASELCRSIRDSAGIIGCMNTQAGLHVLRGEQAAAIKILERCVVYHERMKEEKKLIRILDNIGTCYTYLGKKSQAMKYRERVLALLKGTDDSLALGQAWMHVGVLQENDRDALTYYRRAQSIMEKSDNLDGLARLFNNMGVACKALGMPQEAMNYYEKSLDLAVQLRLSFIVSSVSMNLSNLYRMYAEHDRALAYLSRAYHMSKEMGLQQNEVKCLVNLGWHFHCLGMADSALAAAETALVLDKRAPDLYARMCAYEVLYKVQSDQGNYKGAFLNMQQFMVLSDSLKSESSRKRMEEFNARYESAEKQYTITLLERDQALQEKLLQKQHMEAQQKEQEMLLLARTLDVERLENDHSTAALRIAQDSLMLSKQEQIIQQDRIERNTLMRNIFAGIAVLVLLLAFFVVRYVQQRRRQSELRAQAVTLKVRAAEADAHAARAEKKEAENQARRDFTRELLQSQENERKRIAAELHDELSQDLIILKNRVLLMEDKDRSLEDRLSEVSGMGVSVTSALENVRRISRNLRPMQLDRLGLTSSIRAMLRNVQDASETAFEWTLESVDGLFPKDREINVYRILQEGVNNILKHAEAQQAVISVVRRNGDVRISLKDDGEGFDANALEENRPGELGFGLQGMLERVELLGGNMNIRSRPGDGTDISVFLPVVAEEPSQQKKSEPMIEREADA